MARKCLSSQGTNRNYLKIGKFRLSRRRSWMNSRCHIPQYDSWHIETDRSACVYISFASSPPDSRVPSKAELCCCGKSSDLSAIPHSDKLVIPDPSRLVPLDAATAPQHTAKVRRIALQHRMSQKSPRFEDANAVHSFTSDRGRRI